MSELAPDNPTSIGEIELRVRYPECDPAGVAHHSVFVVWMEMARTELLRQQGVPYAQLESEGVLFVVARVSLRFRKPVLYDQVIGVRTWVTSSARAKVEHEYEVRRGDEIVATGSTTLVCVSAT